MPHEIVLGRTESDTKKFGSKGAGFIGKQYITMERNVSLANQILLDVTRPHVLLIAGKRGSGKCLTGDTLITLGDGSVKPIKDLEYDNNFVLGLNNNLKIQKTGKSQFFKRTVDRILNIKLRSGKEINLTPEHPLLTLKGWLPSKELQAGSRIAAPRKLDFFGDKEMRECEIKLLAYFLAEGHLSNGFALFTNCDKKIVDDFKKAVKEFDLNLKVENHSSPYCFRVSQINKKYNMSESERDDLGRFTKGGVKYEKSSIIKWLLNVGIYNKLSLEKFIPKGIFTLPKFQLALFLNRIFSCDGSIYKHNTTHGKVWQVSYSSSSNELIKQIQHLLLRFEILSRLRTKKIKYKGEYVRSFELVINSDNIIKFIKEIGFFGVKKNFEKEAVYYLESIKRNPNVDTIPKEIWELYKPDNWAEIGRQMNYKYPKAMRERVNYSPSRNTLQKIALIEKSCFLYSLAVSDIFWDEIISIEEINKTTEVYDISVPDLHNFVANDIIVHNSYTMGVIAESVAALPQDVRDNISMLILDTMGIFWTMKYPNYKDEQILNEWNLEPKGFENVKVYVPKGAFSKMKEDGIPVDESFTIRASELSGTEWCTLLNISIINPVGILVTKTVERFRKAGESFDMDDAILMIRRDEEFDMNTRLAAVNYFEIVKSWGIFSKLGTQIKDFVKRGQISVIDISQFQHEMTGFSIRAIVIGLLSKKLLEERIKARKIEELSDIEKGWTFFTESYEKKLSNQVPLVWLMIDEAHEFLPSEGTTAATDALIQVIREGRQPGVSLVLATQQPGKIHSDVMTQCDLVLSHRLTSKLDINALNNVMQSYLPFAISKYLDELPRSRGVVLVLDDKQERIYPMQVRPRISWHGGGEPSAIREGKKIII